MSSMYRPRTRLTHVAVAAALALGHVAPLPALAAATCAWNPASGNWNVAGNWSCGIVPSGPAGDTANIAAGKAATVNDARSIFTFNHAGTLTIDGASFTLHSGGSTANTGTIHIGGGSSGTLQMLHSITNTGGVINIGDGSLLNQLGSTISGGTLNTTGSGKLVANNNGGNFLSGVTLGGTLDMAGGTGIERIVGGLVFVNNATALIGANSTLAPQGDQAFSGTGSIVFADASGSNRFNVEAGNLTLGSGITVRGGNGTIGQQSFVGGAATLTNNGTISADEAGRAINLNVNGTLNNNGTLSALNGGTLNINNAVVGGAGSQIIAGAGSVVNQNGVTLSGAMNIVGTGSFRANNSGNNFLSGVSLSGTLDMAVGTGIERVGGGLTFVNNATVLIGSNSILAPQGDQTFAGSGQIVFADASGSNRLNVEAGTLTLAPGITVRGGNGTIGQQAYVGGAAALVNHGTISADVAGRAINLNVNGTLTNNGTLSALNGGTLNLNNAVVGGAGSQIVAGAGSVVNQNGVTLSGDMNLSGAGSFRPSNSANNFLSGVTLAGRLDLASGTGIERVAGGLTLGGATIDIGSNSTFAPQGVQTIAGSGSFVFADDGSGSNRFNVEAGTLTLAGGVTIRGGSGTIGQQSYVGGAATLIHQGLIDADTAGRTIVLTVNGTTQNQGEMRARNGGTLRLDSVVANGAGAIRAHDGSVVLVNGTSVTGGLLETSDSGVFRASNNSNNVLNGVTLNGVLDLAHATSIVRVSDGGMLLNGRIDIGSNSTLAPRGNQTFGGSGSIVFADASGSNRLNVEAGTTTIGNGVTVRGGNGTIGQQSFVGGAAALVNQGLIDADVAGRTIVMTVNGTTHNEGLMRARNGGTLRLDNAVNNSTGTLMADVGSVVLLNGTSITGGTLSSNGSGVIRASNSSANFINGATLNGVLDLASAVSHLRLSDGGMVLDGRIDIGANSIFAPQGAQTISGSGVINFADGSGSNRLHVEAGTLTLGPGITVHGISGDIGDQSHVGGAATLVNQGTINSDGGGTITIDVNGSTINHGTLRAHSGTLTIQDNLSGTGTLQVDPAGVMNLANGGNAQGRLLMGAAGSALALGNGNLVIASDYTNAGAGSGNSFNRRAGVTGTGQIVAGGDVAQVISGAGVSNGNTPNATLTIGNLRVGDNTFNIQIGNAGTTGPTLRGAIQTAVNGGNLTDARLSGSGVTASNYNAGAPGSNSGDLAVVFTAANAGALAPLAGQLINLRSNFENIADQKLNIVLGGGAAAYNAAVGAAAPSPAVVANQRVGGSNSTTLAVSNTAPGGLFSEDLRATFGANTGAATNNGGMVSALVAQGSDAASMRVGVDTSSAGAKMGTVTLNYQTTGTVAGVSNGLGVAGANAPQLIDVSGNVYQPAAGLLVNNTWNFGTLQVGQQVGHNVVVRNTAGGAAGFVEDLNASFGASGNAQITGVGSLSGIRAGTDSSQTGSGTMTVTVTGTTVGPLNSFFDISYESAGTVNGASNGLGVLPVGSEKLAVNGAIEAVGNVINQANPLINNPGIVLPARRVGDAAATAAVSVTNVAGAPPQAALNAGIASNGAPVTAAGSFGLLAPGTTDASSLVVGLSTAAAGNYTGANAGSATVALVSDAGNVGNCEPNCQLPLLSQTVSVAGKVYAPAIGQLATPVVDFGIVRVGDTVSARNITIHNVAALTDLNDTLRASLGGLAGPLSAGAAAGGIAAQGSGQIAIGLNTGAAGIHSQSATLSFLSQNPDMADVAAGPDAQVQVLAQVNNLADPDFDLLSGVGALSDLGNGSYLLDLGTLALGSNGHWLLRLDNDVQGPADLLRGHYGLGAVDDFTLDGFFDVFGLAAGQAQGGLVVDFAANTLGQFEDEVSFSGFSYNASDPDGIAQSRRLVIRAFVEDSGGGGGQVPEPGVLGMMLLAALAARFARRPAGRQVGERRT